VNSCTSFLFLKDATFNRKRYAELFKMNEQQIALFESLQDREALYMRRDGLTKVVRLNLDSRSYAIFSTKPKTGCGARSSSESTDSPRASSGSLKARQPNQTATERTSHETANPDRRFSRAVARRARCGCSRS
jgi:hypothetical protein